MDILLKYILSGGTLQMTQQPISTDITSDDKIWAALGYPVFIIAIIMLLMEDKKKRPFIKFHAVQALA
ncbi:MAG TPA: hypothetical protein VII93_00865, partial [Anaerolineales bacterium]